MSCTNGLNRMQRRREAATGMALFPQTVGLAQVKFTQTTARLWLQAVSSWQHPPTPHALAERPDAESY
jgi:hypothetical protein